MTKLPAIPRQYWAPAFSYFKAVFWGGPGSHQLPRSACLLASASPRTDAVRCGPASTAYWPRQLPLFQDVQDGSAGGGGGDFVMIGGIKVTVTLIPVPPPRFDARSSGAQPLRAAPSGRWNHRPVGGGTRPYEPVAGSPPSLQNRPLRAAGAGGGKRHSAPLFLGFGVEGIPLAHGPPCKPRSGTRRLVSDLHVTHAGGLPV